MTRDLSDVTRKSIARLIPTLSSNVQGEVAATAGAIERILRANGHDWHDLARALIIAASTTKLDGASRSATMARTWREQAADAMKHERDFRHKANTKAGEGFTPGRAQKGEILSSEMHDVASSILGVNNVLDERADAFVNQMLNRSEKWGTVKVTGLQDRWLRKIAREHGVDVPWPEIELDL